jgi:UDP-N-acetylglucosamine---dolichyl-phosphate N-acetylglucosaminyltransferase
MNMKTIAVIPAYNEATRITPVVQQTHQQVDTVIVVDDHSSDQTQTVAEKAGAVAVRLAANQGAGFATRVGCDLAVQAGAAIIITIDADGQHDPKEIPRLIAKLTKSNADIVYGSRPQQKPMPIFKRMGNFVGSFLISRMFGTTISDTQTGFHAFTAEAYSKLRWESNRYGMVSEFVMRTGANNLKYAEVPVKTIYTDKVTGMTFLDGMKSLFHMIWLKVKQ